MALSVGVHRIHYYEIEDNFFWIVLLLLCSCKLRSRQKSRDNYKRISNIKEITLKKRERQVSATSMRCACVCGQMDRVRGLKCKMLLSVSIGCVFSAVAIVVVVVSKTREGNKAKRPARKTREEDWYRWTKVVTCKMSKSLYTACLIAITIFWHFFGFFFAMVSADDFACEHTFPIYPHLCAACRRQNAVAFALRKSIYAYFITKLVNWIVTKPFKGREESQPERMWDKNGDRIFNFNQFHYWLILFLQNVVGPTKIQWDLFKFIRK